LRVTIDSDTYDSLTDAAICELFDTRALDDWFKREGAELYTLLSVDELVHIAKQGSVETTRGLFELTSRNGTSRVSSRDYYQRYLHRVIDDPETEAKQHLQFINEQQ
jgi:precorrin-6x reductase